MCCQHLKNIFKMSPKKTVNTNTNINTNTNTTNNNNNTANGRHYCLYSMVSHLYGERAPQPIFPAKLRRKSERCGHAHHLIDRQRVGNIYIDVRFRRTLVCPRTERWNGCSWCDMLLATKLRAVGRNQTRTLPCRDEKTNIACYHVIIANLVLS